MRPRIEHANTSGKKKAGRSVALVRGCGAALSEAVGVRSSVGTHLTKHVDEAVQIGRSARAERLVGELPRAQGAAWCSSSVQKAGVRRWVRGCGQGLRPWLFVPGA